MDSRHDGPGDASAAWVGLAAGVRVATDLLLINHLALRMLNAMDTPLTIVFGADHGGFVRKGELLEWAKELGYQVQDVGAYQLEEHDDYPKFAKAVAQAVRQRKLRGEDALGVLLCRSGGGMTMAANRFPGIRAVGAVNTEMAHHGRAHNNANTLVLSGDWTNLEDMKRILQTFLDTPFSTEPRHARRVAQLDGLVEHE